MATSGNFTGTTSNQFITPKIEWSIKQNEAGNYSDVTADLYYKKSSSSTSATSGTLKCSLTIDGNKKSAEVSSFNIPTNNTYQKAMSHTVRVPHNSDGTKSVVISCTGYISGSTLESTTCKSTIKLDDILRASTVTVGSASVGEICKIAIKKASSSFTHTLEYSFGSLSGIIATKTTDSEINWTIPTSFYNEMKTVKSKNGTITCTTYNGSNEMGTSTSSFTVSISDDNLPTLSPRIYINTSNPTYKLTGSTEKFIRNVTKVNWDFGATAKNGATIVEYKVVCGDMVGTTATGQFPDAIKTSNVVFTVTDSRGYSNTVIVITTLIDYVKVSCNLAVSITGSGAVTLKISGNYFNGSFGKVKNSLQVGYKYKTNDGAYGSWVYVTPQINGNSYTATTVIKNLNYKNIYTFQAWAGDAFYSNSIDDGIYTSPQSITAYPVFDWSNEDFNFNVPVSIQGNIMNDFVIEQGVSGIWSYRKWANGDAECWGRKSMGTVSCTIEYYGTYYGESSATSFPSGLFKESPTCQCTVESQYVWATHDPPTASEFPKIYLYAPTSGKHSVSASLHARGKWR